MNKSERLLKFLADRPSLSASGIEREAGIPAQSIAWVKRGRELPEQHWKKLLSIIKKYGYK
jgi:hypothetical protein